MNGRGRSWRAGLGHEGRTGAPPDASHPCYSSGMAKTISQRELRNTSGEIMRALDRGEEFLVTRNGIPVGELRPVHHRRFVPAARVVAAFAGAPPIDSARFRREVDAVLDQEPTPRA